MAAMDYQGSFAPFASIGRSILAFRRDQVHAMDGHHEEQRMAAFQQQVASLFHHLSASAGGGGGGVDLLSVAWVRELLDCFLICQEEFRIVLFNNRGLLACPPLDRLMAEFSERAVKALDVCNAIRNGIEQVRQWIGHIEIILAALDSCHRSFDKGQLRRAKKALTDLTVLMFDGKDSGTILAGRNCSFNRARSSSKDRHKPGAHFHSLSLCVSRSWSATRQIQAIGNNLAAPRGQEITATNGLANPVFTMSSVLLFVMWALVAAIPCQDRGLHTHFSIPCCFPWAASVLSLHGRIMEESKRKDRKNSSGLLKEIHQVEKCACRLIELTDAAQFPLAKETEMEVRQVVKELAQVCEALKDGLGPLDRRVREAFHQIVQSRTQGLDSSSQSSG